MGEQYKIWWKILEPTNRLGIALLQHFLSTYGYFFRTSPDNIRTWNNEKNFIFFLACTFRNHPIIKALLRNGKYH